MNQAFAVLDIETTGLFPGRHDRVLEVAAVVVAPDGTVIDEYETLVNPHRDVGPTHIHGVTAGQLCEAPDFRDIVGDLVQRLEGRTLIGHNVTFDLRFLEAEFSRLGFGLPPVPTLCTLQLSRQVLGALPAHRLGNCCAAVGLDLAVAHRAREDAHATAKLFIALVRRERDWYRHVHVVQAGATVREWPAVAPTGRVARRQGAHLTADPGGGYLRSLVARLPMEGGSDEANSYLHVLERALEDRLLTRGEAEELFATAQAYGLDRAGVERFHGEYLRNMVGVALQDGVISDFERTDLARVAGLLAIPEARLEELILEAAADDGNRQGAGTSSPDDVTPDRLHQLRGLSVCFTGTLAATIGKTSVSREWARRLATNAGMTVSNSVTRRLNLLVVSDPHSESAKARRARELGIRIMSEAAFWAAIGVQTSGADQL